MNYPERINYYLRYMECTASGEKSLAALGLMFEELSYAMNGKYPRHVLSRTARERLALHTALIELEKERIPELRRAVDELGQAVRRPSRPLNQAI